MPSIVHIYYQNYSLVWRAAELDWRAMIMSDSGIRVSGHYLTRLPFPDIIIKHDKCQPRPGVSLVERDHLTQILASDWLPDIIIKHDRRGQRGVISFLQRFLVSYQTIRDSLHVGYHFHLRQLSNI